FFASLPLCSLKMLLFRRCWGVLRSLCSALILTCSRRFRNPPFVQKLPQFAKRLLWLLYQHNRSCYADTVQLVRLSFNAFPPSCDSGAATRPFTLYHVVTETPKFTTDAGPPIRRRWRHQFPSYRFVHRSHLLLN